MYKSLFSKVQTIIKSPRNAWQLIDEEYPTINDIITRFSLPLIGICTIATFIGYFTYTETFNLNTALKQSSFKFSSLFFGLYLSYYILRKLLPQANIKLSNDSIFGFAAYPSSIIYIANTIYELLPNLYFINALQLYAFFIIWHSTTKITSKSNKTILIYSAVITFTIVSLPVILSKLFYAITF